MRYAFLLAFALAGCASAPKHQPFKVPKDQFLAKTHTIALAPVAVQAGVESPSRASEVFDPMIESWLRKAGFETIPCQELGSCLARSVEAVGGLYDSQTGQRDEARVSTANASALRELETTQSFDAVLYPQIVVTSAKFNSGRASWDGVTESTANQDGGAVAKFFKWNAASGYSGSVPALSLVIEIQNKDGSTEYFNAAGIQILAELDVGLTSGGLATIDAEKVFSYSNRNTRAVELALKPLVE